MRIEFFQPMDKIPTATAQEKGINWKTKTVFTKTEIKEVKRIYMAMLLRHKPPKMLEGAIRLKVSFRFPKGRHKEGEWKTTKPDTDNMLKLLKDQATKAGYWRDDSLVCEEIVQKKFSAESGIVFVAEEIEE